MKGREGGQTDTASPLTPPEITTFKRPSLMRVKISKKSQENICTGVSFFNKGSPFQPETY